MLRREGGGIEQASRSGFRVQVYSRFFEVRGANQGHDVPSPPFPLAYLKHGQQRVRIWGDIRVGGTPSLPYLPS